MTYTADYLIEKRKEKWSENKDILKDKELREAIADEIVTNKELRQEIVKYPEKLIELVFVVVDKEQKTVPFFMNEVQQEFINILNKAITDYNEGKISDISILILKGRQQGFTTLITAYQLASSIVNRNFQGYTIADESGNTEAIFQNKAKFPYEQLPKILKPTEKYNNKKQLLFEKINSSWEVDTATENIGRSRTINFFHGSECAFWRKGMSLIQAGLGEAFTKNCVKIYETTANGYNDYQKMWASKNNINVFFEWWKTKEYRLNFVNKKDKEAFIREIYSNNDWINQRLKWLREDKKLEDEQLYWYYKKYTGYIDKDLVKQEYPCSPQEAFLTTGECVFDKEKIYSRLSKIKEPIKRGFFDYKTYYDEDKNEVLINDETIKWIDDDNGYIKIYEDVKDGYPYVIGGDTAGEGSDNFIGQVLDNTSGEQIAVLKHQFDEDIYAKQMYCLGKYYNTALIGIETNYSTYPNKELERLEYPNLYVREREDTFTHSIVKAFGFQTTSKTRPIIIAELIQIARDNIELFNDIDTLEEMLTFVRNEKGRPEAQNGCHDDLIIALAIAHYIRAQQSYLKPKKIEKQRQLDQFEKIELKEEKDYEDYGSNIEII